MITKKMKKTKKKNTKNSANENGRKWENENEDFLATQHGFEKLSWSDFLERIAEGSDYTGRLVLRGVPFPHFTGGSMGTGDLLAISIEEDLFYRIELKWQEVPGTACEKLLSLWENAKMMANMRKTRVVLVVAGPIFDNPNNLPGRIRTWLKVQIEEHEKMVFCGSKDDFSVWAQNTFGEKVKEERLVASSDDSQLGPLFAER